MGNTSLHDAVLHPADRLSLPLSVKDVTAEWLTHALSLRYPGVEVIAVRPETVIPGTATKVRLAMDYNVKGRSAGLPPTMIVKGGLDIEHAHREIVAGGYAREVLFFREVAPDLEINIPHCYFAGVDQRTGLGLLLLEDLLARGVTFGRATSPLGPDAVADALDVQARYHTLWWGSERLARLPAFPGVLRPIILYLLSSGNWTLSMARARATAVPAALRDRERVQNAVVTMWERNQDTDHCLLHGDPHLGNMYFERDGSPGLLDWQGAMRGPWAHDVTYLLIGSLDVEDRRAHERDLLAGYLDRLASCGAPAPGFDDAWLAYRRNVMHGFMWVVNPEELQPEDVNTACATRFAIAAADLDTLGSLE